MTHIDIDKLEAGRELDELIAEHVMGWHEEPDTSYGHSIEECIRTNRLFWSDADGNYITEVLDDDYEFSKDIAAAMQVVEKVLVLLSAKRGKEKDIRVSRFTVYIGHANDGLSDTITAGFERVDKRPRHVFIVEMANTLPLAICRAALKVVMDKDA